MVVSINSHICLGPVECGKCMQECPVGVFIKIPKGRFKLGELQKEYRIHPLFKEICNGCGVCMNICPRNCIKL